MIKATIILWIMSVVMFGVSYVMANSMTTKEKVMFNFSNETPTRVIIPIMLMLLTWIATIVMTIITIIKW